MRTVLPLCSCGIPFIGNDTSFVPDENSDPTISPEYLARQIWIMTQSAVKNDSLNIGLYLCDDQFRFTMCESFSCMCNASHVSRARDDSLARR